MNINTFFNNTVTNHIQQKLRSLCTMTNIGLFLNCKDIAQFENQCETSYVHVASSDVEKYLTIFNGLL
jgi:hypothetical protein